MRHKRIKVVRIPAWAVVLKAHSEALLGLELPARVFRTRKYGSIKLYEVDSSAVAKALKEKGATAAYRYFECLCKTTLSENDKLYFLEIDCQKMG